MTETLITTFCGWRIYADNNTGAYKIKKGNLFWDFAGGPDHNKNMKIIGKIIQGGCAK